MVEVLGSEADMSDVFFRLLLAYTARACKLCRRLRRAITDYLNNVRIL